MLIDLIFALLMIFACIKGLSKGFILALFSIIAFIAGLAAALKLSALVANRIAAGSDISGKWLPALSFILVFLVVVIIVNIGGRLLQKSFEIAMLGWLNRLGGALLFIILYSILYSVFLFYAVHLHLIKSDTIAASSIYQYIQPLGPMLINSIGKILPVFKDLFTQLSDFFGHVSNKVSH